MLKKNIEEKKEKKIDFTLINYFYLFFQIYLIYLYI